MKSRHHKIPKCFAHRLKEFFDISCHKNITFISKREHQAWNILTNNSSMTLGETIESLQRFLPNNAILTIVFK